MKTDPVGMILGPVTVGQPIRIGQPDRELLQFPFKEQSLKANPPSWSRESIISALKKKKQPFPFKTSTMSVAKHLLKPVFSLFTGRPADQHSHWQLLSSTGTP